MEHLNEIISFFCEDRRSKKKGKEDQKPILG